MVGAKIPGDDVFKGDLDEIKVTSGPRRFLGGRSGAGSAGSIDGEQQTSAYLLRAPITEASVRRPLRRLKDEGI
jgi:hypothetical protein